jgi:hypothetical protein
MLPRYLCGRYPMLPGIGRAFRLFGEINQPLEIEELEIAEPGAGEVMVRLAASGTCHSDLHCINGEWAETKRPIVLGHEGAGGSRRSRRAFVAAQLRALLPVRRRAAAALRNGARDGP